MVWHEHAAVHRASARVMVAATIAILLATAAGARGQQQAEDPAALVARIRWTDGPARVAVGSVARLELPAGYRFTNGEGVKLFLQVTRNPPDGSEVGVIVPRAAFGEDTHAFWFVVLSYDDIGHVPDEEKNSLDEATVGAILDSIRHGTDEGNRERAARGWPALTIDGWSQQPFYDPQTHHLTWAIANHGPDPGVNYDSRLLGRTGVLRAKLVLAPDQLSATVPAYKELLGGLTFDTGQGYHEYREGDKVARYGLVGLMTGGAAVAVVKAWKGLAKLAAVVLGLLAAGLAKLKSLFARRSPQPAAAGAGDGDPDVSTWAGVVKCAVCGQANRVRVTRTFERRVVGRPLCGRCKASLAGGA